MVKLLSNGSAKDLVRNEFQRLAQGSQELRLAAPYFTYAEPLLEALARGSSISLLVGLNSATRPDALKSVMASPRCAIRFYTAKFHAKLYVFDDAAMVGSANITEAGFQSNREVVVSLEAVEDEAAVDDARTIFELLWESARSLSLGTLKDFEHAWLAARRMGPDPEAAITAVVGKQEPPSVSVDRQAAATVRIASERLRRQIEQYRLAFGEVSEILASEGLFRDDVADIDPPFRINRFLNWVRLTHARGDAWKSTLNQSAEERRVNVINWAKAWCAAENGRVYEGYAEGIKGVLRPFADAYVLALATEEELTAGLLGIHAFDDQFRFTGGGREALPERFWRANQGNVSKVRDTIAHLLHGNGDFVDRLTSVTTDPYRRIALFGKFCAIELSGTVRPEECPPVNGRSAKALRFLGYKVNAD